ncbi:MAG TPA: CHAD domain-containing protein [Isosphaeraceae bacterium]|nr:CHAD domain-containing protein [Isosphaeraceae bacterium]
MPQQERAECLVNHNNPIPTTDLRLQPPPILARIKPDDPAARAVCAALATARSRMQESEASARAGDSEGIHRLRTATRRLRSELRALGELVDPQWLEPLESELKWLAGVLGAARDVDVLSQRLRKDLAARNADADQRALAPVFAELMARQARAAHELQHVLLGERYRRILAALERASQHPPLTAEARVACRRALPPVAAKAWRRLKKAARELRRSDPDELFHEVRKLAKRARYTAELIAPALGQPALKGARRFIRRTSRVQDVLGAHQDAVVAGQEVAAALAAHPEDGPFAEAAHRLLESQRAAADAARSEFFDLWDRLDRKKTTRWIRKATKAKARLTARS